MDTDDFHNLSFGKKEPRRATGKLSHTCCSIAVATGISGFCRRSKTVKVFALLRVFEPKIEEHYFIKPDTFKIEDYLSTGFGRMYGGTPEKSGCACGRQYLPGKYQQMALIAEDKKTRKW